MTAPARGPLNAIACAVYDLAIASGAEQPVFPALLDRLGALLRGVKDPYKVELVCLRIVEEAGPRFAVWPWLSWGVFMRTAASFEVPRGGWRYALAASRLPDGPTRLSIEYWLGSWYDCDAAGDAGGVANAAGRLALLVPEAGQS